MANSPTHPGGLTWREHYILGQCPHRLKHLGRRESLKEAINHSTWVDFQYRAIPGK
jgi:hypothetical protein